MKKFRQMTVREKIAWICGWNIWSDEELKNLDCRDVEFYCDRIAGVNRKFVLGVTVTAFAVLAVLSVK